MHAVSYKQLRNLTVCLGYQILLSSGMDAVKSPNPTGCKLWAMEWMMWAHKQYKNLTACIGYQILLSSGMDAVTSPNPNGR